MGNGSLVGSLLCTPPGIRSVYGGASQLCIRRGGSAYLRRTIFVPVRRVIVPHGEVQRATGIGFNGKPVAVKTTWRFTCHGRPEMKIGASTYSLRKAMDEGTLDFWGVFDWLADNGAEHIEIVPLADLGLVVTPDLADAMAAKARQVGLDISCYTFGASFIDKTQDEYATELERVLGEIDNAARMGTKLVRHDVASRPAEKATDEQFEQDLPLLVEACGRVADYAVKHGITTMVENHGFHVQGGSRLVRICEEVARDNFRLLVDTGNFFPVELDNTLNAIAQCAPFAAMVHVKDHHIRTSPPEAPADWRDRGRGVFTRVAVAGEGDIGIDEAIRSLSAAGYNGYLSLEYEGPQEARSANQKGFDNLRSVLQQL